MTPQPQNWEEEFDRRFTWKLIYAPEEKVITVLHPDLVKEEHVNALKSFIKDLLATQRQEWADKIKNRGVGVVRADGNEEKAQIFMDGYKTAKEQIIKLIEEK